MSSNTSTFQNFAALTGIRAIAAYMVFLHHTNINFFYIPELDVQRELHIGVTIFFVLSGFLISYRYSNNYELKLSWFRGYFLKRFARIFPVYLLILIPTMFLDNRPDTFLSCFLNLTLLKGFFSDVGSSPIPQAWSLTVEECFYFSAPFIFIAYDRIKSIGVIIISFVFLLVTIQWIGGLLSTKFMHPPSFVLIHTFFGRFFEFVVGFWLAKNFRNQNLFKKYSFQKLKSIYTILGCFGIILCLFVLTQLKTTAYEYGVHHPVGIIINNVILPVFIIFLFYGLITEKNLLSKVLSTKLFQILGKSSYAFYIIHISFIPYLLTLKTIYSQFPVFLILSILIYKYFEEPCNKFIRSINLKTLIPNFNRI